MSFSILGCGSLCSLNKRSKRWAVAYRFLTIALFGPFGGCDDKAPEAELPDQCQAFVDTVKEQCGEDSGAYRKQRQLYLESKPTDAQANVNRKRLCHRGLVMANEKRDYSVPPDFSKVGDDPFMKEQAEKAKKHWQTRKAAYEKMSPEDKKKDEQSQINQLCQLWILG